MIVLYDSFVHTRVSFVHTQREFYLGLTSAMSKRTRTDEECHCSGQESAILKNSCPRVSVFPKQEVVV